MLGTLFLYTTHIFYTIVGSFLDNMQCVWNCFDSFGIILDVLGIGLVSFRGHLGILLGPCWDLLGDRFGMRVGSCWDRFGIVLGMFWGCVGIVFVFSM